MKIDELCSRLLRVPASWMILFAVKSQRLAKACMVSPALNARGRCYCSGLIRLKLADFPRIVVIAAFKFRSLNCSSDLVPQAGQLALIVNPAQIEHSGIERP